MNGSEHVVFCYLFVYENRVLVVIAFPGHEADENVSAECKLRVLRRVTVGKHLTLFHSLALFDDRLLVYASALVGADELFELVSRARAVVLVHHYSIRVDVCDFARISRPNHNARVVCYFMLYARADDGSFGL